MTRTRITRNHPRPDSGGVEYDNTTSGLTAETVQDALDEIAASLGGSLDVTDGTTTVSPTDEISFDPAVFTVTDATGGVAEVALAADFMPSLRWEAVTDGEDVFVWEDDDLVHEWKEYA